MNTNIRSLFGAWKKLGTYLAALILAASCVSRGGFERPAGAPSIAIPVGSATDLWSTLLDTLPQAYTTRLPSEIPGPVDGTYAKLDQSWPQWWNCRRCADYRLAGGIWKLNLDKGVMRIYYGITGWRSIGSFTVSKDHLIIFNDAYCPDAVGEYRWKREGGQLHLETINDACAFSLRAENLSHQPWLFCPSPPTSTGDIPSEIVPPECGASIAELDATKSSPSASILVTVYGGDSRFFEKSPDVVAKANGEDFPPPPGIDIDFDVKSIAYGVHRVLWWKGNWVQASSDLPFRTMGVQFFGDQQIGWARVLFDGREVWRGEVAGLWSQNGRHGGYIEISGFGPGKHVLRAESLDFDYRPVTVVGFGFNYEGSVDPGAP